MDKAGDLTLNQIVSMRRDLEKRIKIDTETFMRETGVRVTEIKIDYVRPAVLGEGNSVAVVTIELNFPRTTP